MTDLARSVVAPRRPWRRALLVSCGTLAAVTMQLALLRWALGPPADASWSVQVVMPAPVSLPAAAAPAPAPPVPVAPPAPPALPPASVPPSWVSTPACPPERRDAPRLTPPELDEAVSQLTVAPSNAGWVAAWNDEHVFVSTDAGAHFRRVLDGPGPVSSVGFDCFGTVVVVRLDQVGLRRGGAERWQRVPGVTLVSQYDDDRGHAAVVSGGPELVIVGLDGGEGWTPRVARSADLGGHWRYDDLEGDWEVPVIDGRQRADGAVDFSFPSADCMSDDLMLVTGKDRLTARLAGSWGGVEHDDDGAPVVRGLPDDAHALGGGLAQAGDDVYRVAGTHARKLPLVVVGDGALLDPAGRVWTVTCGRPWIARSTPPPFTCEEEEPAE